jgi:hypothetical protein
MSITLEQYEKLNPNCELEVGYGRWLLLYDIYVKNPHPKPSVDTAVGGKNGSVKFSF